MSLPISTAPYTKPHACLIRLRLYLPPKPLPAWLAHIDWLSFSWVLNSSCCFWCGFIYLVGWFCWCFFFDLPAEVITKFEIQSVSCSAKVIDVPHLRGNIPVSVKMTVQHLITLTCFIVVGRKKIGRT